jgi:hypothetical protein
MRNLQVNGARLWASLMALAEIGATPKGGVCQRPRERGVQAGVALLCFLYDSNRIRIVQDQLDPQTVEVFGDGFL